MRKGSAGKILLITALLLLIIAAAQYIYFNGAGFFNAGNKELRMTDTDKAARYAFSDSTYFYCNDSRFFYFGTKDGMKYISSSGDIKWQETYSLTKPITCARGDMVAVGEAKGKRIYVFDANGLLFDVLFDEPVLFFSVNENGYLAVILKLDKGYETRAYYRRGGEPIYRNVLRDPLMQPLSADISEDGRIMAVAMLDIGLRMSSRAAFYYMNASDARTTEDGLFAYEDYPGGIIGHIRFMDRNDALVITDTQITCYRPGELNALEERWRIGLHNKLDRLAFYRGARFAFVTGDKLLNDDEASEPGSAYIYNMNGERTGEFSIGRKATSLSMGHDSLIAGADRSFYALNYRGARLWEYIALQDTRQLIFLENTDTALLASGNEAIVLRNVKSKETDNRAVNFDSEAAD